MIAVDTGTWVAYLQGDSGPDTDLLDRALLDRQVLMVPVVLTELLSGCPLMSPRLSSRSHLTSSTPDIGSVPVSSAHEF